MYCLVMVTTTPGYIICTGQADIPKKTFEPLD